MFKLEEKKYIMGDPIYFFRNEKDYVLHIQKQNTGIIMMALRNKGVPVPGDMGLSYFCDQMDFHIDRPLSCPVEEVEKVIENIQYMAEISKEILEIIEKVKTGEI